MARNKSVANDSRKMGEMPIHHLFITMSIPLIISMLVQSLYNVVDSIFVAKICEDALTAVSLVAPFMNLMFAVAAGTGVGFNALIARYLGEKNNEMAKKTANNGIVLMALSYLVFLVVGLTGTRAFICAQATDPAIIEYGVTYMKIIVCLSIGMFGQVAIEKMLQATGKTVFPMITQMSGALCNILFDWMLIFGIGPFPEMGVAGAALATIFGQCLAMVEGVIFNAKFNKEIQINVRYMKPQWRLILEIYKIGIPSIIMISIGSLMTFCMNKILMAFSSTAVAVFGVYFKLQSIIFMPGFGMNNAMIPIIGYNYGSRQPDRIRKVYKVACIYVSAIMAFGIVLFHLIPDKLLLFFSASDNMLSIGVPALEHISISFVITGICIISSGMFQALGRSMYSMVVSILRQLAVLLPVAVLLARTGVLDLVWYSLPISEAAAMVVTIFFLIQIFKLLRSLEANAGVKPGGANQE